MEDIVSIYRPKNPKVDRDRRRYMKNRIEYEYRRVGSPVPTVLFAGNFAQYTKMFSDLRDLATFQLLNERLKKSELAKMLGVKTLKQPGSEIPARMGKYRRVDIKQEAGAPSITKGGLFYSRALRWWGIPKREPRAWHHDAINITQMGRHVLVMLYPVIHSEEDGRGGTVLHNAKGPAIVCEDGTEEYWFRGIRVNKTLIMNPGKIKATDILRQTNQELRRLMIHQSGAEKFIKEGGFELINKDEYGILWKTKEKYPDDRWVLREIRRGQDVSSHMHPITMVEVINGTPEKDGSLKHYFLQVDPNVESAHAAVAWTYGLTPATYNPLKRT
jgi:hypothetical protein